MNQPLFDMLQIDTRKRKLQFWYPLSISDGESELIEEKLNHLMELVLSHLSLSLSVALMFGGFNLPCMVS